MACAIDPYQVEEPYQAIRNFIKTRDADAALAILKASGLRGLGGAGFPTESKWQMVRQAPAPTKFIVCNADESEPGTFKDRFILAHLPHLVIEGMILAGLITGAQKGVLYIRHEYEEQERILHEEIRHCEKFSLLGPSILGSDFSFELDIFVSPGGYICGEETALLEAIEGRRAEPRIRSRTAGEDVQRELARLEALWTDLRTRFGKGGPYLFGAHPTIADAFYAPVATRLRTYGVTIGGKAKEYAEAILADAAFLSWEKEAVAETWTMPEWDNV